MEWPKPQFKIYLFVVAVVLKVFPHCFDFCSVSCFLVLLCVVVACCCYSFLFFVF